MHYDTAVLRVRDLRVSNAWKRAVGKRLARVSEVQEYRRGKVTVRVQELSWKRALDELKPTILKRLHDLVPGERIDTLTFRLCGSPGEFSTSGKSAERPACRQVSADEAHGRRIEPAHDLHERLQQVKSRYLSHATALETDKSRVG